MGKQGTAGNMRQPIERILVNNLTAEFMGFYTDGTTNTKVLQFKKHGWSLEFNGSVTNPNMSYVRQCTDAGTLQVKTVTFDDDCPCVECGFNYGIIIKGKHMNPGYFNDHNVSEQKPYGDKIKNISGQCISNALSSSVILTMVDTIINNINADMGYYSDEAGAIVLAGRSIEITTSDAWANDSLTINGTAYGPYATRALLIAGVNAGTDAYAFAHPTDATKVILIANDAPTTLTLTAGTNVTFGTTVSIGLISKDVKWQFEVSFQDQLDATGTVFEVQAGKYPWLTAEDVFRIFSGGFQGHYASGQTYIEQPLKNDPVSGLPASYCRYIFRREADIDDVTGAGHWEHIQQPTIEVYILDTSANLAANIWDATNYMWDVNDTGFTADTTLAQFITAFGL